MFDLSTGKVVKKGEVSTSSKTSNLVTGTCFISTDFFRAPPYRLSVEGSSVTSIRIDGDELLSLIQYLSVISATVSDPYANGYYSVPEYSRKLSDKITARFGFDDQGPKHTNVAIELIHGGMTVAISMSQRHVIKLRNYLLNELSKGVKKV